MELVEFDLDGGRYALPMTRVIELAAIVRHRPLPGAPATVEGMINHAGTAIPLVSLRAVFGLPPRDRESRLRDHLIIAQGASRIYALRVDHALGLITLDPSAIRESTPSRHVRGVAVLDSPGEPDAQGTAAKMDLLYIQDLDALLSLSEEAQLADALSALETEPPALADGANVRAAT